MARRMKGWGTAARLLTAVVCVGGVVLGGCHKTAVPVGTQVAEEHKSDPPADKPAAEPANTPESAWPDDRLHQAFAKATRPDDEPPEDTKIPVDQTIAGKPTGVLASAVKREWQSIRFTTAAGKRVEYVVTLDTELGPIEITLYPDVAPNHVRNFLALVKAGYYNGLCFDRVRHEESEDDTPSKLDQIEAGCPLGTGEPGLDHLGYWLRDEFDDPKNPKLTHDEGTVGACHGDEMDSAACRFYITLNKASFLDGNYTAFGKVTKGLDVARIIFQRPVIVDDQEQSARRPEKPVTIRKATIRDREGEATR